jgi:hypothetical protein
MDEQIEFLIEKNWKKFDECFLSKDHQPGEDTAAANAFAKLLYRLGALEIIKALEENQYKIVDTKCTCWRCQGFAKDPYENEE